MQAVAKVRAQRSDIPSAGLPAAGCGVYAALVAYRSSGLRIADLEGAHLSAALGAVIFMAIWLRFHLPALCQRDRAPAAGVVAQSMEQQCVAILWNNRTSIVSLRVPLVNSVCALLIPQLVNLRIENGGFRLSPRLIFDHAAQLTSLRVSSLHSPFVLDGPSFPRLRSLHMSLDQVKLAALEAFAQRTPSLTSLCICAYKEEDGPLARLATLLTGIDLHALQTPSNFFAELSAMPLPRLRSLRVSGSHPAGGEVLIAALSATLEDVAIRLDSDDDLAHWLQALAACKNLTALELRVPGMCSPLPLIACLKFPALRTLVYLVEYSPAFADDSLVDILQVRAVFVFL